MQGKSTLFGVGRDRGMAEQILVPALSLVALPRSLDATTRAAGAEVDLIGLHPAQFAADH